jgi:hypothetical protein
MWEPRGCFESVQHDAHLGSGCLECHESGVGEMRARTEGIRIVPRNAAGRGETMSCHLSGTPECLCKHCCT